MKRIPEVDREYPLLTDAGGYIAETEDHITNMEVAVPQGEHTTQDTIPVTVRFSVQGSTRKAFNEHNWTKSYEINDVSVKIKYGIKLVTGGIRKRSLGKPVDAYRKAAIFWTRNPKLVNPMKEKRVWVQVSKNFAPVIRLTEEEVRQELFDFEEKYPIKGSELGEGRHKIGGEVHVSWQKHHLMEKSSMRVHIPATVITVKGI